MTRTICHLRWVTRRDMPEVVGIETQSFEHPWTEDDFLRALRRRNCIGMVAEHNDRIVGFMIYELHARRLHLLNFAVAPHLRRTGVGTQMVAKLIGKLSGHRRSKITLATRERNLAAQLFFRSQGLEAVSVLPRYYEDSGEDAYAFEYRLPGADEEEWREAPPNRLIGYFGGSHAE